MTSTVLVTGGAGFIGSHVVDRLRAAGHRARILDTRPSPWHDPADVETVLGDVRDLSDVRRAIRGCDAVCHLAAAADVGIVEREPAPCTELNALGTLTVLEAARLDSVERVVYASTVWVYSDVEGDVVDEEAPLAAPAHLYTAGKLSGELFCRSYAELYGLRPTVLRFGIPYGPRARPAAVIPSFVRRALDGEPLSIAGSGEQERAFVYVEDLAEGVVRALAPQAAGRTYNLAASRTTTVRQLAEVVRDEVADVPIVHADGRSADLKGATIVADRAAAELGWRASTSLREGVRRYVAWLRDQDAAPVAAPVPARTRPPLVADLRTAGGRLAALVREPVLAAAVAIVAVLSALLPVWATAHGNEASDAVTIVGLAFLIPLTLLAVARWPAELRAFQVCCAALIGGAGLLLLSFADTADVVSLGHHPVSLMLSSAVSTTALAIVPPRIAAVSRG